jgi:hypothetical protein
MSERAREATVFIYAVTKAIVIIEAAGIYFEWRDPGSSKAERWGLFNTRKRKPNGK